jgi:nitrogen fixation/metabolism regulation signal transduction histidine kinase
VSSETPSSVAPQPALAAPTAAPISTAGSKMRQAQVRLVVSIPVLMFLYAVFTAAVLHFYLGSLAEMASDDRMREEAQYAANSTLLIGIGAGFVAAVVGLLLAWQIVRPVQALTESMRNLASGQLQPTTRSVPFGEIETLGTAFNEMVRELNTIFAKRDTRMREAALGTVFTLDEQDRVLAAEPSLRNLLDIEPDWLMGDNILRALREACEKTGNSELPERVEQLLSDARRGLKANGSAKYRRRGATEDSALEIRVIPLETYGAVGPARLLDIRDLSSIEGFHLQLQRADRLAAVGTLATGIAHEIRNPLASIRAMAQLLEEDVDSSNKPEGANAYLERMIREVDRLDKLVSSIMDFARSANTPAVPTDMNALLREAYEVGRHRVPDAESERIKVSWNLWMDLPRCKVEDQRVLQAFINMVLNALEALAERGEGELRFSTYQLTHKTSRPVTIVISNTADPVSPQQQERMFEPFQTTKANGTGLGLPIAYQIITSNRGVLELRTSDGMMHAMMRFPAEGREAEVDTGGEITHYELWEPEPLHIPR